MQACRHTFEMHVNPEFCGQFCKSESEMTWVSEFPLPGVLCLCNAPEDHAGVQGLRVNEYDHDFAHHLSLWLLHAN